MRKQPASFSEGRAFSVLVSCIVKRDTASPLSLPCIFQSTWQTSDQHGEASLTIIRLVLGWVHVELKPKKSTQALQTGYAAPAVVNYWMTENVVTTDSINPLENYSIMIHGGNTLFMGKCKDVLESILIIQLSGQLKIIIWSF